MSATAVRAAVFDFDGTLADSMDHVLDVYNAAANSLGVRSISHAEAVALKKLKPMEALSALDVPLWKLPFIVRAVRAGMRARITELRPFEGLNDALRTLKERGVRCYVLSTNSKENIETFLVHHGMQHFHELAGGSSVFGKASHLKKLVKREGLSFEHVHYVGDEVRDVTAAREAGTRIVSVSWGYSDRAALVAEAPDFLVDTPAQLVDVLTR